MQLVDPNGNTVATSQATFDAAAGSSYSGSVPLAIPGSLAVGNYQLKEALTFDGQTEYSTLTIPNNINASISLASSSYSAGQDINGSISFAVDSAFVQSYLAVQVSAPQFGISQ